MMSVQRGIGNVGSIFVHPMIVFVGTWTFVYFLYSLGLSWLLIYDVSDFLLLYACTVCPFFAGFWYVQILVYGLSARRSNQQFHRSFQLGYLQPTSADRMWRRVIILFRLWAVATIAEIAISGGIPIVWVLTGSGKNYQDFGIQSVHGLLMSMLLSSSMVSFYLYLETKERRYAYIPLFAVFWFIASITRGFLIGIMLQCLVLALSLRRPRATQILKIAGGFVCLILFFGIVGDLRSAGGGDLIRAIARPTDRYPDWLPSGFLWVYIYLATPLNNLFHTVQLNPSVDGFSIATTTAQLFPTVIRNIIFPGESLKGGDLVDSNLNVSTGFMGPYLDMGLLGITFFSLLCGSISGLFWSLRRKLYFLIGYTFVAHALALSIFSNLILFLPYLFQLFWLWILLRSSGRPTDGLRVRRAAGSLSQPAGGTYD